MAQKKKRRIKNPVARTMETFNKPKTFRDRKNDYKRNEKHKGQGKDPYFLTSLSASILWR